MPYGLRGVLWYQGESNAADAAQYQALLSALMHDWRRQFGADLPFLIVELPNFGAIRRRAGRVRLGESARSAAPRSLKRCARGAGRAPSTWAMRAQLHPPDKQSVGATPGARGAAFDLWRDAVGVRSVAALGATRDGARVVVSFDGVDGALVAYSSNRPIAI